MDTGQLERVRALREKGLSPKEIARALGIPRAKAAALIRTIAAAEEADPAKRAAAGCWVSAGWSDGLTVTGRREWPDEPGNVASGGLVGVLVARDAGRGRVSACGYLVDVFCLGVKNSIGPRVMDHHALPEFVRTYFAMFQAQPLEAPFELARHLVLGAVEYARDLGFEPPASADFDATRSHLGSWEGPSEIGFGRDGKPFFIAGPSDNPERVMKMLQRSAGAGNFHFLVGAPA